MSGMKSEVKDRFTTNYQSIDITVENIDIVSCDDEIIAVPVDRHCSFSAGISKIIAEAAGPLFKNNVNKIVKRRRFRPGEVLIFDGHDLNARLVFAAVSSTNLTDIQLLYEKIFRFANNEGALSLCVSGIGTGILGVHCESAAKAACQALKEFASNHSENNSLKKIHFVDLKSRIVSSFMRQINRLLANELNSESFVSDQPLGTINCEVDEAQSSEDFCSFFNVVDTPSGECCPVCLADFSTDNLENPTVELSKCHHAFHKDCITHSFRLLQAQCPVCKVWYDVPRGNQPFGGKMTVTLKAGKLPGYPDSKNYIEICYSIPSGVQTEEHLRPGVPFFGTTRHAYLPYTSDGLLVLELLRLAFRYRLIFTVGDSVTTGAKNVVVWNNIHHKTNVFGGAFGYPDDNYLSRVKEELASLGINEQLLQNTRKTD
uniref:E3 ubiquitin-protein ligase n=1 Tax=Syphacia muris TaxID=451379 RepID=A0A0N5AKU4_9BILA